MLMKFFVSLLFVLLSQNVFANNCVDQVETAYASCLASCEGDLCGQCSTTHSAALSACPTEPRDETAACQIQTIHDQSSITKNEKCCEQTKAKSQVCCADEPMKCLLSEQDNAGPLKPDELKKKMQSSADYTAAVQNGGAKTAGELSKIFTGLGSQMNETVVNTCQKKISTCESTCDQAITEISKAISEATLPEQILNVAKQSKYNIDTMNKSCDDNKKDLAKFMDQSGQQEQNAQASSKSEEAAGEGGGMPPFQMPQFPQKEKKPETAKDVVDCNNSKYSNDASCAQKPNPGQAVLGSAKRELNTGDKNGSGLEGGPSDQSFAGFEGQPPAANASAGVSGGGGQFLGGGAGGGGAGGDGGGGDGSPFNANVMNGTSSNSGGSSSGMTTGGGGGGSTNWAEQKQPDHAPMMSLKNIFGMKNANRGPAAINTSALKDGISGPLNGYNWEKVTKAINNYCLYKRGVMMGCN
jgi:hypothetical protein